MYHNDYYSDRITNIFNSLIKITEMDNLGELLQGLFMTKTYDGYELIFTIRNNYNNPNIMFESILQTTDKLLEWFDITEICNFTILIHINDYTQRYYKMSYFELFEKILKLGRGYDPQTFRMRGDYAIIHPRYERFMRWAGERNSREEREKIRWEFEKEKQERMLRGGINMFHESDITVPIKEMENKGFVRKVKDYFINLWYV